jgi:hypothetical protein
MLLFRPILTSNRCEVRSAICFRESAREATFFFAKKNKIIWDTLPDKSHFALSHQRIKKGNNPSLFLFN